MKTGYCVDPWPVFDMVLVVTSYLGKVFHGVPGSGGLFRLNAKLIILDNVSNEHARSVYDIELYGLMWIVVLIAFGIANDIA
jgi:hypothetical protein